MGIEGAGLRWGVERRLEFIEFRLLWEGGVNRSDITERFGVSVPQASKDLTLYQDLAPKNMIYDRRQKRYFAAADFSPRFMKPDSDRYLSQLRTVADGALDLEESWLSQPPPFEAVPLPHRHVGPAILRTAIDAIRERKALEIRYQSLSIKRPEPTWRWISPHALAFDGNRWHVRAFCHIDRSFKDFLLPRILKARATADAEAGSEDDSIWNELITVSLKAHPGLTDEQKRVVAQDFGMKGERVDVKVRLALLYYMLRRLDLDDFQGEKHPAREQHVVLANRDEVRRALKRAQAGLASTDAGDPPAATAG
jgi:predicted DNA-binding transcriptional regulator YafY